MGIEVQSLKLLLLARQMGIDFGTTLTIGRQDMLVSARDTQIVFGRFGTRLAEGRAAAISGESDPFSDAVFTELGATSVDFMDVSDFEGATIIQDLNQPLDDALREKFSLVFDGGTLEHVFDCPRALGNYMMLPRIGGHLIIAVPANNEMGHGFYQFSPELFFRTLTRANGYRIRGLFIAPMFVDADWLAVRDPATVGARVGYNASRRPNYLFVVAERVSAVEPFATAPQQSDYAAEWTAPAARPRTAHVESARTRLLRAARSVVPARIIETARDFRAAGRKPDSRSFVRFAPGTVAAAGVVGELFPR